MPSLAKFSAICAQLLVPRRVTISRMAWSSASVQILRLQRPEHEKKIQMRSESRMIENLPFSVFGIHIIIHFHFNATVSQHLIWVFILFFKIWTQLFFKCVSSKWSNFPQDRLDTFKEAASLREGKKYIDDSNRPHRVYPRCWQVLNPRLWSNLHKLTSQISKPPHRICEIWVSK